MTRQGVSGMLKTQATRKKRPDGSDYLSLSFRSEKRIVEESEYSHNEIQIMALQLDIVPERYARNQKSLGLREQIMLLKSSVIVVGLGGLGGGVTEILARVGIGELILVDGDVFEDSNLNRQLLSRVEDLGRKKAIVAENRVLSINPGVNVHSYPLFLDAENCRDLLGSAALAVDCLDNIPDRFVLETACRGKKIPLVSAAIGGLSGQATVVYPEDPGLSLIYGQPENVQAKGVEKSLGTLPYSAITMAAIQCSEVVSYLTGNSPALRNRLLFADLSDYSLELLNLA
jgi:molybdopterin/thiamine biosynthesis adenylyltransferase